MTHIIQKASRQFKNELDRGVSARHDYQVIVDSPSDTDVTVINALGVSLGTPHPLDPFSVINSIEATRQGVEWSEWKVVILYSRQAGSTQDTQSPPTLRPVKRAATTTTLTVSATHEKASVRSSLGFNSSVRPIAVRLTHTPYDPPPTITLHCPTVTFQRWEEFFSTAKQKEYCGHVNTSQFGAYPEHTVMCTRLDADEQWENDGNGTIRKYWLVTYEFTARVDGHTWFAELLNADYFRIDPDDDDKRKAIYFDDDGLVVDPSTPGAHPASTPVILDPFTGDVATPEEIQQAIDDGNFDLIYNNIFYTVPGAEFNALQLPVD